ncbi:hypothetical protein BLNAU_7426 [Blattamonas nauphoetae]|uniref:Uncharacterized protein n=1 Tax=Blattamonas nauphoetae TaxID=2049346 RepID=A0ABQ9Y1C1_9EUKA|nr:hypothetical protein BLNAU_7426 [Blattamonas nauphoetae]
MSTIIDCTKESSRTGFNFNVVTRDRKTSAFRCQISSLTSTHCSNHPSAAPVSASTPKSTKRFTILGQTSVGPSRPPHTQTQHNPTQPIHRVSTIRPFHSQQLVSRDQHVRQFWDVRVKHEETRGLAELRQRKGWLSRVFPRSCFSSLSFHVSQSLPGVFLPISRTLSQSNVSCSPSSRHPNILQQTNPITHHICLVSLQPTITYMHDPQNGNGAVCVE